MNPITFLSLNPEKKECNIQTILIPLLRRGQRGLRAKKKDEWHIARLGSTYY